MSADGCSRLPPNLAQAPIAGHDPEAYFCCRRQRYSSSGGDDRVCLPRNGRSFVRSRLLYSLWYAMFMLDDIASRWTVAVDGAVSGGATAAGCNSRICALSVPTFSSCIVRSMERGGFAPDRTRD
jgi:hypothetical protein